MLQLATRVRAVGICPLACFLTLATLLGLVGCSATPPPDTSHGLSVGLVLSNQHSPAWDDSKDFYPFVPTVVLVGDGVLYVRLVAEWQYRLVNDVGQELPNWTSQAEPPQLSSAQYSSPLFAFRGVDQIVVPPQYKPWPNDAPIWQGYTTDRSDLKAAERYIISCKLFYLSRNYEYVEQTFRWQVGPELDPETLLLPIDR